MFVDQATYGLGPRTTAAIFDAGAGYLHYLHGVNPLGKVYLSNMGSFGAEDSVDQFYHSWFADGSAQWDSVRTSTFGPAPGFVVGGPNPSYGWDDRCPGVSPACGSAVLSPPTGQPAQKSYLDFNTSWPLNSWSVTENSNGYQAAYIRLLSRMVIANRDCSGTPNGTASYDVCGQCTGGNTGKTPKANSSECADDVVTGLEDSKPSNIIITPNPTYGQIHLLNPANEF